MTQDRFKLFKKFGYDIPKARKHVVAKACLSGKILEIGTGKGHLAVALAKKGLKFISIDMDREAQRIAREGLKALCIDKLVTLKIMDAQRLQYKDRHFDSVISVSFLHHARRPLKCVKEMIRVTKSCLVLADVNKKGALIMEKVHALEGNSHPRSKISFNSIKKILEKSGMKVNMYDNDCETVLITKRRRPI